MKTLFPVVVAVAMASIAPTWAAEGKPCTYQDLMPAYQKFATETESLPPEQRAAAFIQTFAPKFPDYYAPEVFGDAGKAQARAARFFDPAQRAALFPDDPPLTDAHLAEVGSAIGPQFTAQQRKFMRTFADFHCATTVEFGISLLKFDGHPVDFGGKPHLLFGVDVIAMLHDTAELPSFFDHELFHLYHRQVVGSRAPQGADPAWWTMWVEGLATYVSQRMNPGLDAQHVLWSPRDMVARMETDGRRAANLVLRDIDKTGPDADRWFLMSSSVEGLPYRAGYYLGYLFARSVGDGVPLPELARMSPTEVHERELTFLTKLSR
jgi:hypothetical protein